MIGLLELSAIVIQLAILAALGAAAWWASALADFTRGVGERLLVATLFFLSACCGLVLALGGSGLLSGTAFAMGASILFLASLRFARPASQRAPAIAPEWPALPVRFLAVVVAALHWPFLLKALFVVPLRWDTLTYHLFLPGQWIATNSVFDPEMSFPLSFVAHYPKHFELVLTSAMVIARSDLLAELLALPLSAIAAVATGCLCRRLGGSRDAAWCAGLTLLTIPAVLNTAGDAYVEPMLNTCLIAAIVFAIAALQQEERCVAAAACAGLALGLAIGTKYSALYLAALLVPLIFFGLLRAAVPIRRSALALLVFGLTAIVTGGYWYALNAFTYENPFYPVPVGPFLGLHRKFMPWDGSSILSGFGELIADGRLATAWLGGWAPDRMRTTLGWKLVALIPLAALGIVFLFRRGRSARRGPNRDERGAWLALAAAAILLFTYLNLPFWKTGWLNSQTRFAIPFLCVALAAGWAALGGWIRSPGWLAALLAAGILLDAPFLDVALPDLWWEAAQARLVPGHTAGQARLLAGWMLVIGTTCMGLLWVRRERSAHITGRTTAILVGAGALLVIAVAPLREAVRFDQLRTADEVRPAPARHYADAARWLETERPGAPIAVGTSGDLEFLYMFGGRRLDRMILQLPRHAGEKDPRAAWLRDLQASPAQLLVGLRWPGHRAPREVKWARALGLREVYADEWVHVFAIRETSTDS